MENYYYLCFRANALHLTLRVRLLAMSAAFDFRKCKRLLLSSLAVSALYRGPRGILCTRGEKENTSKRVSINAPDNAISEAKCATRTRLRRRTLRCTLHYASKLARSRCKANALFLRSRL